MYESMAFRGFYYSVCGFSCRAGANYVYMRGIWDFGRQFSDEVTSVFMSSAEINGVNIEEIELRERGKHPSKKNITRLCIYRKKGVIYGVGKGFRRVRHYSM